MRTDYAIVERAGRGIELLDRVVPNWRKSIDPGTLNIRYNDKCVLGQLTGDFNIGLQLIGLTLHESANYGFNVRSLRMNRKKTDKEVMDEFNDLKASWRSVLYGNKN